MMQRIARYAARWWWAVIAGWVAVAAVVTLVAPSFAEVATYGEGAFLPGDADAVRGNELLESGWDDNFTRATTVALVREDGELTDPDREYARELVSWLESGEAPDVVNSVATHLRTERLKGALTSEDGQAMLVVVGFDVTPFSPVANRAVEAIRDHIDEDTTPPDGLDVYATGTAAVAADQSEAIDRSVERAHLFTIVLVVLILLLVYRSPVAPLVPLATIGVAYLTAVGVVSLLADAGMDVSSLFQTFSIVLVFGAGTDYCLLLVSRYHEELELAEDAGYERSGALRHRTLVATMAVLGTVIASSAATVIVGFSAQGVAEFGLFRTMGPAMAIAIAITLAAGLTLTPALMKMFGRTLFWPHRAEGIGHGDDELLIEREGHGVDLDFPGSPHRGNGDAPEDDGEDASTDALTAAGGRGTS